ncbi:ABC-2 family transporter permease [Effusibacillus dendaii]|uniref:Uncharacterized protein n=1 Tax=Effusibacillus dendaii TaxID=2743772 RepID=A0A7I8DE65_9BACL|nr:hypothetical protein [Effusibacillus dendaii]BCJ87572.1 hypothetical protein skT53_25570 [Effusibacillus dendaii]
MSITFKRLLATDFRNVRTQLVVALTALLLLQLIAFISLQTATTLPGKMGLALTMSLSMAIVMFIPPIHAYTIWHNEWKQNSIYLLLALPVSKNSIFWSKFIVILSEYLLLGAAFLILMCGQVLFSGRFPELPVDEIMKRLSDPVFISQMVSLPVSLASFIPLIFMSVLAGKAFRKHSTFITGISIIALFILTNKIDNWLLADKANGRVFVLPIAITGHVTDALIQSGVKLMFAILFWLGSVYLLKRKIEL